MTQVKKDEPTPKKSVKVLVKRSIWVKTGDKAVKVKAGEVVELSAELVKHFGKCVTKDLPDDEEE